MGDVQTSTDAADYTRLRDRIEAVAAMAQAASVVAGNLDDDRADALSMQMKADVADSVWSELMSQIARLDS